jgi:hypothetical protein
MYSRKNINGIPMRSKTPSLTEKKLICAQKFVHSSGIFSLSNKWSKLLRDYGCLGMFSTQHGQFWPCSNGSWDIIHTLNFSKITSRNRCKFWGIISRAHFFPRGRSSTMTPAKNRVRTSPRKKIGPMLPILTPHPHNVFP